MQPKHTELDWPGIYIPGHKRTKIFLIERIRDGAVVIVEPSPLRNRHALQTKRILELYILFFKGLPVVITVQSDPFSGFMPRNVPIRP